MAIEAIGPVNLLPELAGPAGVAVTPQKAPSDFGSWFVSQLSQVNDKLVNTDTEVQQLATGQASNLHEVMIHLEEAKLSFQLMLQVRNRMLEAYQDVMRTQI